MLENMPEPNEVEDELEHEVEDRLEDDDEVSVDLVFFRGSRSMSSLLVERGVGSNLVSDSRNVPLDMAIEPNPVGTNGNASLPMAFNHNSPEADALGEARPVDFCEYIENEVKYGNPDAIPRFCPVPKVKGIYHPTQEQTYIGFIHGRKNQSRGITTDRGCAVNKKLPGTLGNPNAISKKMRHAEVISANNTKSGTTRFIFNSGDSGERYGQPGGITPPLRNRF